MENALPTNALPAWEAYTTMGVTKKRYFEYLQHLEQKYKKYGQPNSQEQTTLDNLLQQHDTQVTAFNIAVQKLRIADPSAYAALVRRLSLESTLNA